MSVIQRATHRSIDAGPRSIAARRSIGVALTLIGLVSMNACYAFIPTTSTTLAAATPVTVKLTLPGTVALQPILGQGVNELDGTVLRSSNDSLVVAIDKMYTLGRQAFGSSGTTAALARPYIEEVQVRTFSRKRTTLMVIGAIAVGAVAAASIKAGGGSDAGGTGPTPASIRRP